MTISLTRRAATIAGTLAIAAAALAGCGSSASSSSAGGSSASSSQSGRYGPASAGSSSTTTMAAAGTPQPASSRSAIVALHSSSLGMILVDGPGRTLYLWKGDSGTHSACTGACAAAWPPLTTQGTAKAGSGVSASELGTSRRSDGSMQVTYNGHPLYLFEGDTTSGQANGQGSSAFGATWYVVSAAGDALTGSASGGSATGSSSTGSSGSGGSGY